MDTRLEKSGKTSRHRFRTRRYGVYDLTYEAPSPFSQRIYSSLDDFRKVYAKMPHVRKLAADAMKLAPAAFIAYLVTTFWGGIYYAINLYWLNIFFDKLCGDLVNAKHSPKVYQSIAASWLCCAMINVAVSRIHTQSLDILAKRLRAFFLPLLISASLRIDLLSIRELCSIFPVQGRFELEFPAGLFLNGLSYLIRRTLEVICQVLLLLSTISSKPSPEREILLFFCIACRLISWLVPFNAIGTSAYIYWPDNRHFLRMKSLFGLAFSTQYRTDLMLDGIAGRIETEYKKSAQELGNSDILEPIPWGSALRRDWSWDVLSSVALEHPLAAYAFIFSSHLSPSSVSLMILLLQIMRPTSTGMRHFDGDSPTLLDICSQAEQLYHSINHQGKIIQGIEPFPRPNGSSYDAGMKISFRRVSLLYPGGDHHALRGVTFDVLPGELVIVVGANGSGKSTMSKLLARLFDPTSGDILIDDVPIVRYDLEQLRAAMAFQSQTPVVYPVSLRENIAFSLPPSFIVEQHQIEEAAQLGGCSEWIARVVDGYDARLEPSFDINNQWSDGMYGRPSEALRAELDRHNGRLVSISGGEKQRLATARTFMRIVNCMTRLLVVDEATSALDPIAERTILTRLCERRHGKTMIVITHRFHHLVHEADRILCMKDGFLVESGTHAELVRLGGEYTAMYQAQAERSD